VQPKRRNAGWCTTLKDHRIYDFMTGATSAKPSPIEIDGTLENIRVLQTYNGLLAGSEL
jgi:hypothetical protein